MPSTVNVNLRCLSIVNITHLSVIDIMDFIKYDPLGVSNQSGTAVQHGPQNFRRHNKTVGVGVNLNITSDEPNTLKPLLKLAKLLIR